MSNKHISSLKNLLLMNLMLCLAANIMRKFTYIGILKYLYLRNRRQTMRQISLQPFCIIAESLLTTSFRLLTTSFRFIQCRKILQIILRRPIYKCSVIYPTHSILSLCCVTKTSKFFFTW